MAKGCELNATNNTVNGTALNGTANSTRFCLDGEPNCEQCRWGKCADMTAEDHPVNKNEHMRNATVETFPSKTPQPLDVLPDDDEESEKDLLKPLHETDIELDAELESDLFRSFPEKKLAVETEEDNELFSGSATVNAAGEIDHMLPSFATRHTRGDSAIFNASHAAYMGGNFTAFNSTASDSFLNATSAVFEGLKNSTSALLGEFSFTESKGMPSTTDMQSMFLNYYNSTAPDSGSSGRSVTEKLMNASLAQTNGAYDDVYFGSNYFNNAPANYTTPAPAHSAAYRPCRAGDDRTECLEVLGEPLETEEENGWLQAQVAAVSGKLSTACKHCKTGALVVKAKAQQAVGSCPDCEAVSSFATKHLASF